MAIGAEDMTVNPRNFIRWTFPLCLSLVLVGNSSCSAAVVPPDPARVAAIEGMLAANPRGVGGTIWNRSLWDKWAREPAYQAVILKAEELAKQPLPEQPDEYYLAYLKEGKYPKLQECFAQRRGRIAPLVLAECLENKRRFLPAIEAALQAVCQEKTWVLPPSDKELKNFNGETTDIDIGSTTLASDMAQTLFLLGNKLSPQTRDVAQARLKQRIIEPFEAMVAGTKPLNMWMTKRNNLNAVCLSGIAVVGLSQIDSKLERARFLAGVEKYSKYFLEGFPADGYCTEGLGYWNYGFGHYLLLADMVRRATGGKIDLLASPKTRNVAAFGAKIQILDGVAPAFADSPTTMKASGPMMAYLNRKYQMGLPQYVDYNPADTFNSLVASSVYALAVTEGNQDIGTPSAPAARDWFESSGVLVARPLPGSSSRFGVALKGGNNTVSHNHTDLGSYVVVNNGRALLLDPGRENYTLRTFGPRRYEGPLLNSWGHAVPLVAKQLQLTGAAAKAVVVEKCFTDAADTVKFDITSAYGVPDLEKLERTLVYSRPGSGQFTVTDKFRFKTPQEFGTALITVGSWQKEADGSLTVYDVDQAVRVEINTGGQDYAINAEKIREDAPVNPTRIGINLVKPSLAGEVTISIKPLKVTQMGDGLLSNGDFEHGTWGWQLHDGLAELSTEKVFHGRESLKISDPDATRFATVNSARIPVENRGALELRGAVRREKPIQLDFLVNCLDANGQSLSPMNALGEILPVGSITEGTGKWQKFGFRVVPPTGTVAVQVSVKTLAPEIGEAFLDDLELVGVR